jgi:hypothetical protein
MLDFNVYFLFYQIKSLGKYDIALVVLLTGISVFTYVFFKTPFNNGDSARSIGVFLQHFAMNYSQWHHTNTPFWLDYADILRQNFDNHTSLKGIIQSNPEIIKKHFLSNIYNYSTQTGKIIFSFFAPVFTKKIHWLCLMVSVILFGVYFSFTKTIRDKRKKSVILNKGQFFYNMCSVSICISNVYSLYLCLSKRTLFNVAGAFFSPGNWSCNIFNKCRNL